MFKLLTIALFLTIYATSVHSFSVGSCVTSPVDANFDAAKYLGFWYEIERSNVVFETELKCVTATYSLNSTNAINVRNYGLNKRTNVEDIAFGYATIPDVTKPNQLLVQFPQSPAPGQYHVWSTDYTGHTLIYSCQTIIPLALKFEMIWILARTPTLDQSVIDNLKGILKGKNIDTSKFEQTIRDADCVN